MSLPFAVEVTIARLNDHSTKVWATSFDHLTEAYDFAVEQFGPMVPVAVPVDAVDP